MCVCKSGGDESRCVAETELGRPFLLGQRASRSCRVAYNRPGVSGRSVFRRGSWGTHPIDCVPAPTLISRLDSDPRQRIDGTRHRGDGSTPLVPALAECYPAPRWNPSGVPHVQGAPCSGAGWFECGRGDRRRTGVPPSPHSPSAAQHAVGAHRRGCTYGSAPLFRC